MKVLIIFTGGTIGSMANDGFIAPNEQSRHCLLENYYSKHGTGVEFETMTPYWSLSETLNAEKLNILTSTVAQHVGGYDGIIVTHGTDTLQYAAAALSLTVECHVPVVVVSSNYPLDNPKANGNDNFYAAVEFIKSGTEGVFVAYRNDDGKQLFHRTDRVLRHAEMSHEVQSAGSPFALLKDGKIEVLDQSEPQKPKFCGVKLKSDVCVLNIVAHPNDRFKYSLDEVGAVLFQPYHSGTLDTENPEIRRFCFDAASRKIPVFACDIMSGDQYETSREFAELGVVPLINEPSPFSYMKLWYSLSK